VVNNLRVTLVFDKGRYMLDRSPAGNVPFISLAEDTVQ
jgi:hypothetical protein